MKTIILKSNQLSLYLFEDSEQVSVGGSHTSAPNMRIGDLNSSNATLISNVSAPEDWSARKYFYQNNEWVENPEWEGLIEPAVEEVEEPVVEEPVAEEPVAEEPAK